jgi:hypothetical protein
MSAVLALTLFLPLLAHADTKITVTGTTDNTALNCDVSNPLELKCNSLRSAIRQSNMNPSTEFTILLDAKHYLTRDPANPLKLPEIVGRVTIQGKGTSQTSIHGVCYGRSREDERLLNSWECGDPTAQGPVLSVGEKGTLILKDLMVQDGQSGDAGGILNNSRTLLYRTIVMHNHAHLGAGGIKNTGYLYIEDSTITHNTAHNSNGGGIQNVNTGKVTIFTSTIDHNKGACAGGIYNSSKSPGSAVIINSTISTNLAYPYGNFQCDYSAGGILNDPGDVNNKMTSTITLRNVTITRNMSYVPATFQFSPDYTHHVGGVAAVFADWAGGVYFYNTLIAGNLVIDDIRYWTEDKKLNDLSASELRFHGFLADCRGVIHSLGGNLVGTTLAGNTYTGTQQICKVSPVTPWLSDWPSPRADDVFGENDSSIRFVPLADNGGATCTHALPRYSLAKDRGWPGVGHIFACEKGDQRGEKRTDGHCDIGAYEWTITQPVKEGLDCH